MGQLTQALAELEEHLAGVARELRTLKEYAASLEEENSKLKRQICAVSEADIARVQANAARIRHEETANLEKLYAEGFHVCHIYFGEPMMEPCLFCTAFLGTQPSAAKGRQ